ncbi:MAG: TIGR00730 family Rossman fold protein [Clostridia bacterium]|nr:TIGR00730 family Rossman fold protein [Clostridia bacterium]
MNICVYGASSNAIDKTYILAGELLGEEMAKRGHTLVFGAGASGLMGAVARGIKRGGGKIIGVVPSFFNADGILYEHSDELIRTETMRERKQKMEDLSDAFIMSPGGIGTFEEFFEIMTLKQLARHNKAIAVLNTKGFYDSLDILLKDITKNGFMQYSSLDLYELFADPESVLNYIEGYIPKEFDIADMKHIGRAN